jgi:hypothetical protein
MRGDHGAARRDRLPDKGVAGGMNPTPISYKFFPCAEGNFPAPEKLTKKDTITQQ